MQAVCTYASTHTFLYLVAWLRTYRRAHGKKRLQTHYTMSKDRSRRRRSTRQKDGRVSDPQSSYTRRPQLALLYFLSVLSERAEVIYLLAATILYRAAAHAAATAVCWLLLLLLLLLLLAVLLGWVPQTARSTNQKGTNAQGIRHRHITSPAPHHGIARPNAYSRRRGPCRHAPSCTKVKRCCAAMSYKPARFLALFSQRLHSICPVYLTNHRGD